jgi:hypothetical protein
MKISARFQFPRNHNQNLLEAVLIISIEEYRNLREKRHEKGTIFKDHVMKVARAVTRTTFYAAAACILVGHEGIIIHDLPVSLFMSSTHRSSTRSNRSPIPSVWRSLPRSKKSTQPPSVSFIFAEPEQGAPLASAVTKLPTSAIDSRSPGSSMKKLSPISLISTLPQETGEDERVDERSLTNAMVTSGQRQNDATPVQGNSNCTPETPTSIGLPPTPSKPEPEPEPSNGSTSIPLHSPDPIKSPSAPPPSPGRTSWFGSLSRTKGKERMVPMMEGPIQVTKDEPSPQEHEEPTTDVAPTPSVLPSVPIPPLSPPQSSSSATDQDDLRSQPQSIPSQKPARRWFSSSTSPTWPPILRSPLHSSHPSVTSSIDEEVPKIPDTIPPQATTSVTIVPSGDATNPAKLSSLNPSTSRFTLSIPLLGRPKMPLDQAVAVVQNGGASKNDDRLANNIVKPDPGSFLLQASAALCADNFLDSEC